MYIYINEKVNNYINSFILLCLHSQENGELDLEDSEFFNHQELHNLMKMKTSANYHQTQILLNF